MRSLYVLYIVLMSAGLSMAGQQVVLIRATSSAPNKAEQNYAGTVTRHIDRWLTELNVDHRVITDDEAADDITDAKVAIMGYNPQPNSKQMASLSRFMNTGGKLIVFYCQSPRLAKLMGMRLGNYKSAGKTGKWRSYRFDKSAPPHLPSTVTQESHNIRPAYPAEKSASVIAYWCDSSGKPHSDPAWTRSDRGFWMSHVLLNDGDSENKKQMLLALIGFFDPNVWSPSASSYLRMAETLGKYRNYSETSETIIARVRGTSLEEKIRQSLAGISSIRDGIIRNIENKEYAQVVERSRQLERMLTRCYTSSMTASLGQMSLDKEFRAVWDHSGRGLYPGNWDRTCRFLADQGITDIIPNMLWSGAAHYNSSIVPPSATLKNYGDQVKQCIFAAHKNGIKVHIWKVCWKLDHAPQSFVSEMKKAGRLQVTSSGKTCNWLCPSHPENLRHEKDAIREVLSRYAVDGIHLDYIRYNNSGVCFCSGCRSRFQKASGIKINNWPGDVLKAPVKDKYNQWRCNNITALVRDTGALSKKINPSIKVSAAVFGKYPSCKFSVAQDWPLWLKEKYVDFVCPMNYTDDDKRFREYCRNQMALPSSRGRIFPGIGVTAKESNLGPVQLADQVGVTRELSIGGFIIFDLNSRLAGEVLPLVDLDGK